MKTVLITGANTGIGFETAKQLENAGYFVYIGSRDEKKGNNAIDKLNKEGISNVELIVIDVTNINSIKLAKQQLENKMDALDVLINNAGISGETPQNIITLDNENLRIVFGTNFFGAVQTTQQFISLLKKSDAPRIVNVSSSLGSLSLHNGNTGNPSMEIYDAYSASKTALNALTVLLANQLKGTNFKVNSVAPGYTATALNDFKGHQTVEEAAKVIVQYATLSSDGPTGGFFDKQKALNW